MTGPDGGTAEGEERADAERSAGSDGSADAGGVADGFRLVPEGAEFETAAGSFPAAPDRVVSCGTRIIINSTRIAAIEAKRK
ncbi:hypothetical protein IWX65_003236 [Arthrobacter sp. CAN_A214]